MKISQEKEKENMKEEYKRLLQEKAKTFLEEKRTLEFERDKLKANLMNIENSINIEFQKIEHSTGSLRKYEFLEEGLPLANKPNKINIEIVERLKSELIKMEEKMQGNKLAFIEEKGKLNQEMKKLKDDLISLKIKNGKLELENEFYRVKHKEIIKELKKAGENR